MIEDSRIEVYPVYKYPKGDKSIRISLDSFDTISDLAHELGLSKKFVASAIIQNYGDSFFVQCLNDRIGKTFKG